MEVERLLSTDDYPEIELSSPTRKAQSAPLTISSDDYHKNQHQQLQNEYLSNNSSSSASYSDEEFEISPSPSKTKGGGHGHEYPPGTATSSQVAVNIFISFVGAGMLGMPYAFSKSGWLLGILALSATSIANVYCMLLLVKTRRKLEDSDGHTDLFGHGDVGRVVAGYWGESLVNGCLVLSQVGFGTAYLIFVAENLHNIAKIERLWTCIACVPILAILVQITDMKKLSPVSLFADVVNITGLCAVLFEDYQVSVANPQGDEDLTAINYSSFLYVTGVAIYSLEGVGLVLPLESSHVCRDEFPSVMKKTIFGITSLMIVFGCSGYYAFGSITESPITLNLGGEWATVVKLCLCVGLYLTFPMMMFPVNEVLENFFLSDKMPKPNRAFRTCVVIASATIAYAVPNFGLFLSLVGSSICTLLAFILPCYFHLLAFGRRGLKYWEIFLDYFLIGFGVLFGILGTYESFSAIMKHNGGDEDESLGGGS